MKVTAVQEAIDVAGSSLSEAIDYAITSRLIDINTADIGRIIKVDGNTVDVQPMIDYKLYAGGSQAGLPLRNLPLYMPSSSGSMIYIPVKAGDLGIILTLQRDISNFKISATQKEPPSFRYLNKGDSIFYPMGTLVKSITPSDPNSICIENTETGDSIIIGGGSIKIIAKSTCIIEAKEVTLEAQTVTLEATTATIKASMVHLGGIGGVGVARMGDSVQVDPNTGIGTITMGSTSVLSK